MNPNDPNISMVERVADRLGPELRATMVFVGGVVTGLLITDPAQPRVRPTEDVDLIAMAVTRGEFHEIEQALQRRGFLHDTTPGAPICRWRIDNTIVDVMPPLPEILGFVNRWYPLALSTAVPVELAGPMSIRVIAAPVFLATKLEAFSQRGCGDFLDSPDMSDVIAVIDGREALLSELRASAAELQAYVSNQFSSMLATPAFLEALPGHLPGDLASQERLPDLVDKLRRFATYP